MPPVQSHYLIYESRNNTNYAITSRLYFMYDVIQFDKCVWNIVVIEHIEV